LRPNITVFAAHRLGVDAARQAQGATTIPIEWGGERVSLAANHTGTDADAQAEFHRAKIRAEIILDFHLAPRG